MNQSIQHPEFRKAILLLLIILLVGCSQEKGKYFEHKSYPFGKEIEIEYEVSNYDSNKKSYITKVEETDIDPNKTALVIIDLWRLQFLDSLTINYINPLVKELDSLGVSIIYSPSNGLLNRHLEKLSHGTYFYNLDMMDKYIRDKGIENLIYVGYDTLYCILDKPNGIFSFQSRNSKDFKMFVMEKGVLSATEEMKKTGIELLKKNDIGVIKTEEINFLPTYHEQTNKNILATTKNGIKSGSHFVVIFKKDSTGSEFKNFEINLEQKSIPYAEVFEGNMTYDGNPLSEYDFVKLLREKAINNIYYTGYHINNEILWSDYGLISMYMRVRYNEVPMPRFYCLNDLTYVTPSDKIAPEIEKATIINHYHGLNNIRSESLLENILETQEKN